MPLVACYNCGVAMSDQAAVCQRCAAPARRVQPPAPPRRTSETMRFAQVAALAACVVLAMLKPMEAVAPVAGASDASQAAREAGAHVGFVIGSVIASVMMSGVLLVWLRRTRPFIPFLALGFSTLTFLATFGAGAQQASPAAMDREVSALRQETPAAAASPAEVVGPPPAAAEAKAAWVTRRYRAELQEHLRQVAALHGVGRTVPPPAWSTTRYMAEAGTYPGIGQYWENTRAYAADLDRSLGAWGDSTLRALGREARLPAAQVETILREQVVETDEPGPGRWALEGAVAEAALAYHRYLVSIDPRVRYDAGDDQALFERAGEAAEAQRLAGRVEDASRALEAYRERHPSR